MTDESSRLASLKRLEILDTPPHPAFDALTKAAAQAFQTPISLISLVDETRQWFKSHHGTDLCETDRAHSFCAHAIQSPDIFVVEDASADPVFASNPLVTDGPRIRFYAGAPLLASDGHRLGTLCVIDVKPRKWPPERSELLSALAVAASHLIELCRTELLLERAERLLRSST